MRTNRKFSTCMFVKIFFFMGLVCLWSTISLYGQMVKVPSEKISAVNKHFGIQLGANYFRKAERIGYKIYKNNQDTEGKFVFDNDGYSYQLGIVYFFNDYLSILAQYRAPRKSSYHYPATWTPFVYGVNTYWTKTEASSWIATCRFHFKKVLFIKPYAGLGIDYYKIKAYNRAGHIDPNTGEILYIFPENNYEYLGCKNIIGFLLPLGITVSLSEKAMLDFSGNYTFIKLKNWGEKYDRADNQNMSGFYLNLNLVFLIW